MGIANKWLAMAWNKDYLCWLVGLKPKPIGMQSPWPSGCFCALSVHQSQNPHQPQFGQRVAGIHHAVCDSSSAGAD